MDYLGAIVHLSTYNMKRLSVILTTIAFLAISMTLIPTDTPARIVFFGDSITELGVKPNGYIDRLKTMLAQAGKKDAYQLIGAGIGGNKVYDLYLRLEEDVLSQKPDVVVIWVGVNDVWHKRSFGTGTDADKFERFYVALIRKIQAAGAQVIVATPAAIGERTDFSNELDGDLNLYSQIIRRIAAKYDCKVADFRQSFLEYNLKHNPQNKESGILTYDRVHLNDAGNQLVADVLYQLLFE